MLFKIVKRKMLAAGKCGNFIPQGIGRFCLQPTGFYINHFIKYTFCIKPGHIFLTDGFYIITLFNQLPELIFRYKFFG